MIVDADGSVLAHRSREEGEGRAIADVRVGGIEPSEDPPDRFWIPELPLLIRFAWAYQNLHGRLYYRRALRTGRIQIK